jgi:hypothetical protein
MNCRESAPRVLQRFERLSAFAKRRRKIPPIFCGQSGTGKIGGQLMAIAARCCSGHEQSVRDTELNNSKGFLSGVNPVDPIAEAPGSFRHTQRFHCHSEAHTSLGGQTPICPCDATTSASSVAAASETMQGREGLRRHRSRQLWQQRNPIKALRTWAEGVGDEGGGIGGGESSA